MSVEHLFGSHFNLRDYNCWHLVRDVWLELTGKDLGLPELLHHSRKEMNGVVAEWSGNQYRQIDEPANPCIVLMQREGKIPHVGVHIHRKVIHLDARGVHYQPRDVATLGFTAVRYYLPCL